MSIDVAAMQDTEQMNLFPASVHQQAPSVMAKVDLVETRLPLQLFELSETGSFRSLTM